MTDILDRPAWSALNSRQAALAEGGALARRYPPSIIPFAATGDDDAESLKALEALAAPGETLVFLQAGPVTLPAGLTTIFEADAVQMITERPLARPEDDRIVPLNEGDAEDMLALAQRTKPGPFSLRALAAGPFWGIRHEGRLVAMAGQRMQPLGFTEVSGLCTHPDFRAQGLGRLLLTFVAAEIAASGDTAFLHAFANNSSAIALYEQLGFRKRAPFKAVGAERRM